MLAVPRRYAVDRPTLSRSGRGHYFFGVGCGFMLFEIYMIHYTGFVLGDPVLGFSAVITALLTFSGLGGLLSRQWPLNAVRMVLPGLIALFAAQLAWQAWHPDWMLKFAFPVRLVLVLLIMLPAGLLIGTPFPLGMKHLASGPAGRASAWSVNGCASVLSAILAAQLAISFGLACLLIGAMIAYGISLTGVIRYFRAHPPG
jgi:predicted membrane-bound spermidine synthase